MNEGFLRPMQCVVRLVFIWTTTSYVSDLHHTFGENYYV